MRGALVLHMMELHPQNMGGAGKRRTQVNHVFGHDGTKKLSSFILTDHGRHSEE